MVYNLSLFLGDRQKNRNESGGPQTISYKSVSNLSCCESWLPSYFSGIIIIS
jgi:hypothetical protein